jgi:nicotinamidase-related amidase
MINSVLRFLIISICAIATIQVQAQQRLEIRGQRLEKHGQTYKKVTKDLSWPSSKTAIIICDMWDQHWCATATKRVGKMAPLMNEVVKKARKKGVTIIHAPSSTMDFYKDYPQRRKMTDLPMAASSAEIPDWCYLDEEDEDPLPIDDSNGGCDDPASDCVHCEVWKRQIATIEIMEDDCISDSGKEINNYLEAHQIDHVILMGVHINMCVLGRSFGIRSQIKQGRNVVLVRDLTDSMYDPEMPPKVSHSSGTNLVIDHVEKFWCPTITSDQLMK